MLDDITSVTVKTALTGLAMRQRVTADNIANIETPGFLAGRVSFENSLRTAVENGSPAATSISNDRSLEPTRLNGNNVNLDTETLSNIDTVLRFQFAARAVNTEFTAVRSALRTS